MYQMVRVVQKEVQCGFCHHRVNIDVLLSYSAHKVMIDGNQHHSLQYKAIQICPHCGHIALDISLPVKKISSPINLDSDALVNKIIQGAKTYALNNNHALSSYMYRLASWKTEDEKIRSQCKESSNRELEHYLLNRKSYSHDDLYYFVIMIDTYRQLAQYSDAKELCLEVLQNLDQFNHIEDIKEALELELHWIENHDVKEHSLKDE